MPCYANSAAHLPEVCRVVVHSAAQMGCVTAALCGKPSCSTRCFRLPSTLPNVCRWTAGAQKPGQVPHPEPKGNTAGTAGVLMPATTGATLELVLTLPICCVQGRKRKALCLPSSLNDDADIETEPDLESMAAAIQLFKQQAGL